MEERAISGLSGGRFTASKGKVASAQVPCSAQESNAIELSNVSHETEGMMTLTEIASKGFACAIHEPFYFQVRKQYNINW